MARRDEQEDQGWIKDVNGVVVPETGAYVVGGAASWLSGPNLTSDGTLRPYDEDRLRKEYRKDPSFALRLRMLNTLVAVYCNANAPEGSGSGNIQELPSTTRITSERRKRSTNSSG